MLENAKSSENYVFNFDSWICGSDVLESAVLGAEMGSVEYEVTIVTSSCENANTSDTVSVNLMGTEGM